MDNACKRLFSVKDVAEFLNSSFKEFKLLANLQWREEVIIASYKDVSFGIFAKFSTIELAYNIMDKHKMSDIINAIKQWEKIQKAEDPFCVEYENEEKNTHSTIIEASGVITPDLYERMYGKNNIKEVTKIHQQS
ncbi:MAG: hypothetical protein HFJ17_05575 [Clostridia bacterium]|nr:hypothetical protein [Clostridia bacterium]